VGVFRFHPKLDCLDDENFALVGAMTLECYRVIVR